MAVSLSINPIDSNNYINASNATNGISITGTSSDSILANLVGQTVSVVLNGKTYAGTIGSDGTWSVNVGATDLAALTNDTTYTATGSVTDLAGKKASSTDKVVVDETATLAIKGIDGNGFINAKNAAAGITISGTSIGGLGTGDFAGRTVTVTLNSKSYSATIAANGTWSVSVGATDLAALSDGQSYTVTASATDKSGNAAFTSCSVTVDETTSVSINPIDSNNYINASNVADGITITGTTSDSMLANLVGQTVSVVLNGKTYTGSIGGGGRSMWEPQILRH
jgi:small nuclear ribonucleoprotein (snRNP)-like protein